MKIKTIVFATAMMVAINVSAQETAQKNTGNRIPETDIKKIDGNTFNTKELTNNGKPMVISFWATWCKPCVAELTAISEQYTDWQKETGVKVVAISIDDSRNMSKVGPFINGKSWDYEVYVDPNGDFKRALNVNNVPHTFLLNGKGEIVWQHASYAPGDEVLLYENIKKVAEGKEVKE